jgi:hypothetical protein
LNPALFVCSAAGGRRHRDSSQATCGGARGALYYAHEACANRNERKPLPKPRPDARGQAPSLAESLATWNVLVDELEGLLATMRAVPHTQAAMKAACAAWNANSYKTTDMVWAIADPRPDRPYEADDHCRKLKWHVERLKAALARDPLSSARRGLIDWGASPLTLPDSVNEIRAQYAHGAGAGVSCAVHREAALRKS